MERRRVLVITFLAIVIVRPSFSFEKLWKLFLFGFTLNLAFILPVCIFNSLTKLFDCNNNSTNTTTIHSHRIPNALILCFEFVCKFLLDIFKALLSSHSHNSFGCTAATTTRAQRRRTSTRKDCLVCTDTKNIAPVLPCGHDGDICSDCVLRHASNLVHSNRTAQVNCLLSECAAVYTADDIRAHGGDELAREMESVQTTQAIEQMPNFRWCSRPGCDSGQIHDDVNGTVMMMTCDKCGAQTCTHHRAEWHTGMTCKQYDKKLKWIRMGGRLRGMMSLSRRKNGREVNMNKVMKTMKIKACPKCGQGVQKNGGCDHVSCSFCAFYLFIYVYFCILKPNI